MFGYVTPLKPELKVKEYNRFRGYYCGLCRSIQKHFGNIPRLALNYDMTFLALFLDGLSNNETKADIKRCLAHPSTKRPVIEDNDALCYAASMNILLVYFKLIDDVNDDKDLKSKSLSIILSSYKKKLPSSTYEIGDIIKKELNSLNELEKNLNFSSIDEIAHPFSEIVGKILELYPYELINDGKETRDLLYDFGYSLGKWIYLIDALDDLEEDIKKNKFNPINFLFNTSNKPYHEFFKDIKHRIEFSIFNVAYTCHEILDKLEFKKNKEILKNIIDLGMMDKYVKICNKGKKD